MGLLSDRVAIVSGGASGIGAAICSKFAAEGARVIVADIDFHTASALAERIRSSSGDAVPYRLDVTRAEEAETMARFALERFGKIDILVNSAGIFNFVSTDQITPDQWKRIMDVDLNGTFYCCLYVGREMLKRGQGKIVNISSMAGIVGIPNSIGYVASKHGVVGITRALAIDYGKRGVNVNCLCPGTTLTPMVSSNYTKEYLEMRGKRVPLGRLSTPEEQAEAALFLASDASDYVNGLIMYVDGGMFSLFSGYAGL